MSQLKKFVELLIECGLANQSDLRGCSEAEIDELEKSTGFKLPRCYREFLDLIGQNAGDFQRGSDFLYGHIFPLTDYARETMLNGPFQLPENAFVFFSHQGYIFAYFKLLDGDNPPVFTYLEGEQTPLPWAASITEYLEKSLEEELNARRSFRPS
jgi:SMI1 / KNR4 family (SUKH-1)